MGMGKKDPKTDGNSVPNDLPPPSAADLTSLHIETFAAFNRQLREHNWKWVGGSFKDRGSSVAISCNSCSFVDTKEAGSIIERPHPCPKCSDGDASS